MASVPPYSQGRQLWLLPLCFTAHQVPFEKDYTLKGSLGNKFILFAIDRFLEGRQTVLTELPPQKVYPSQVD